MERRNLNKLYAVCSALIAIIATQLVFYFDLNNKHLLVSSSYEVLQHENYGLTSLYSNLQTNHTNLFQDYDTLEQKYDTLESLYTSLENEYLRARGRFPSSIPQTGRVIDEFNFDAADDENVAANLRWFVDKQGTGDINIQDDDGYHRDSLRIYVSSGDGDYTLAKPLMSPLPLGKFGLEFLYKPAYYAGNRDCQLYFGIEWHVGGSTDPTDVHMPMIKVEFRTSGNGNVKVYYLDENNQYQTLKDYGCPMNNLWWTDTFIRMKLIVDLVNQKYMWLQIGQDLWNLSAYSYRIYRAVTNSWWFPFVKIENNGSYALYGNVDDLVITADETMHPDL